MLHINKLWIKNHFLASIIKGHQRHFTDFFRIFFPKILQKWLLLHPKSNKMNTHIINIGDELLIGQVINTNASWMSQQLTAIGCEVSAVFTIADRKEDIVNSLKNSIKKADVILITGGLGPTKDDITKHTLCEFFHSELVENEESLRNIERIFTGRGYPMTPTNRLQASVPACCKVIVNEVGTAPCMWFEQEGKIIVSMPGVPSEMKFLMEKRILPELQQRNKNNCIVMKNLLVQGIGESFLSDLLEPWETQLPANMGLAYLPQHGMLRLRLSAKGSDKQTLTAQMEKECASIYALAGQYIVGEDKENLQAVTAEWLLRYGKTLSSAESCTGGSIASRITAMPGASAYFKGGVVAYSNELKEKLLGVSHETLLRYGAVSKETVIEMVNGIRRIANSDFAVATTGIAGPDGGTQEKPVGTVWIAVASPHQTVTRLLHLSDQRSNVIERTCNQIFSEIIQIIRSTCDN